MTRRRPTAPVAYALAAAATFGALLAPAAAPAQATDAFESIGVTRPGTVLVDRGQRLIELEKLGPAVQRFCHARGQPADDALAPLAALEGRLGYGGNDERSTPFDWAVIVHGTDAFTGSLAGAERFVDLLSRWAAADAMTTLTDDVAGSNTSVVFGLKRSLAALIPAWALAREGADIDPTLRARIDAWIGKLVTLADVDTGGTNRAKRVFDCPANAESSNCNNHRYLRDLVNVMWGAMTGDHARYRRGVERVHVALRQMRPDGSLPLETQRGARALWYQNYALSMLTTIAEVAAHQGHDLYALDVAGRSLHKAVAYLIEAIARPTAVLPYAKANVNPGLGQDWHEQDLRFTERRGRWHHMAWTEAYTARFRDHPNTRRLKRRLPGLAEDRPLLTRVSGGNASCFFARP